MLVIILVLWLPLPAMKLSPVNPPTVFYVHLGALAASTRHEIVSGKPNYCILLLGALAASTRPGIVSRITTYSIQYPGPAQPS